MAHWVPAQDTVDPPAISHPVKHDKKARHIGSSSHALSCEQHDTAVHASHGEGPRAWQAFCPHMSFVHL
jgi:hypothetical protein